MPKKPPISSSSKPQSSPSSKPSSSSKPQSSPSSKPSSSSRTQSTKANLDPDVAAVVSQYDQSSRRLKNYHIPKKAKPAETEKVGGEITGGNLAEKSATPRSVVDARPIVSAENAFNKTKRPALPPTPKASGSLVRSQTTTRSATISQGGLSRVREPVSATARHSSTVPLQNPASSTPNKRASLLDVTPGRKQPLLSTPTADATPGRKRPLLTTPTADATPGQKPPLLSTPTADGTPGRKPLLLSIPTAHARPGRKSPLLSTPTADATPGRKSPLLSTPTADATPGRKPPLLSTPTGHVTPGRKSYLLSTPTSDVTPGRKPPLLSTPTADATPCQKAPLLSTPTADATPCQKAPLLSTPTGHATPGRKSSLLSTPTADVTPGRKPPLLSTPTAVSQESRIPAKQHLGVQYGTTPSASSSSLYPSYVVSQVPSGHAANDASSPRGLCKLNFRRVQVNRPSLDGDEVQKCELNAPHDVVILKKASFSNDPRFKKRFMSADDSSVIPAKISSQRRSPSLDSVVDVSQPTTIKCAAAKLSSGKINDLPVSSKAGLSKSNQVVQNRSSVKVDGNKNLNSQAGNQEKGVDRVPFVQKSPVLRSTSAIKVHLPKSSSNETKIKLSISSESVQGKAALKLSNLFLNDVSASDLVPAKRQKRSSSSGNVSKKARRDSEKHAPGSKLSERSVGEDGVVDGEAFQKSEELLSDKMVTDNEIASSDVVKDKENNDCTALVKRHDSTVMALNADAAHVDDPNLVIDRALFDTGSGTFCLDGVITKFFRDDVFLTLSEKFTESAFDISTVIDLKQSLGPEIGAMEPSFDENDLSLTSSVSDTISVCNSLSTSSLSSCDYAGSPATSLRADADDNLSLEPAPTKSTEDTDMLENEGICEVVPPEPCLAIIPDSASTVHALVEADKNKDKLNQGDGTADAKIQENSDALIDKSLNTVQCNISKVEDEPLENEDSTKQIDHIIDEKSSKGIVVDCTMDTVAISVFPEDTSAPEEPLSTISEVRDILQQDDNTAADDIIINIDNDSVADKSASEMRKCVTGDVPITDTRCAESISSDIFGKYFTEFNEVSELSSKSSSMLRLKIEPDNDETYQTTDIFRRLVESQLAASSIPTQNSILAKNTFDSKSSSSGVVTSSLTTPVVTSLPVDTISRKPSSTIPTETSTPLVSETGCALEDLSSAINAHFTSASHSSVGIDTGRSVFGEPGCIADISQAPVIATSSSDTGLKASRLGNLSDSKSCKVSLEVLSNKHSDTACTSIRSQQSVRAEFQPVPVTTIGVNQINSITTQKPAGLSQQRLGNAAALMQTTVVSTGPDHMAPIAAVRSDINQSVSKDPSSYTQHMSSVSTGLAGHTLNIPVQSATALPQLHQNVRPLMMASTPLSTSNQISTGVNRGHHSSLPVAQSARCPNVNVAFLTQQRYTLPAQTILVRPAADHSNINAAFVAQQHHIAPETISTPTHPAVPAQYPSISRVPQTLIPSVPEVPITNASTRVEYQPVLSVPSSSATESTNRVGIHLLRQQSNVPVRYILADCLRQQSQGLSRNQHESTSMTILNTGSQVQSNQQKDTDLSRSANLPVSTGQSQALSHNQHESTSMPILNTGSQVQPNQQKGIDLSRSANLPVPMGQSQALGRKHHESTSMPILNKSSQVQSNQQICTDLNRSANLPVSSANCFAGHNQIYSVPQTAISQSNSLAQHNQPFSGVMYNQVSMGQYNPFLHQVTGPLRPYQTATGVSQNTVSQYERNMHSLYFQRLRAPVYSTGNTVMQTGAMPHTLTTTVPSTTMLQGTIAPTHFNEGSSNPDARYMQHFSSIQPPFVPTTQPLDQQNICPMETQNSTIYPHSQLQNLQNFVAAQPPNIEAVQQNRMVAPSPRRPRGRQRGRGRRAGSVRATVPSVPLGGISPNDNCFAVPTSVPLTRMPFVGRQPNQPMIHRVIVEPPERLSVAYNELVIECQRSGKDPVVPVTQATSSSFSIAPDVRPPQRVVSNDPLSSAIRTVIQVINPSDPIKPRQYAIRLLYYLGCFQRVLLEKSMHHRREFVLRIFSSREPVFCGMVSMLQTLIKQYVPEAEPILEDWVRKLCDMFIVLSCATRLNLIPSCIESEKQSKVGGNESHNENVVPVSSHDPK